MVTSSTSFTPFNSDALMTSIGPLPPPTLSGNPPVMHAPATATMSTATAILALQRKSSEDAFESDSPPSRPSLNGHSDLSSFSPKMHAPSNAATSARSASPAAKPARYHRRQSSQEIVFTLSPSPSAGSPSDNAKMK